MGALQRRPEPGLLDHPAPPEERRIPARPADLGANPVLGEGRHRRPKSINAKAETVASLPSFWHAYRRRRCLLPVDNFFEWKAIEGAKAKQPYAIAMKSREPFALAAIWENWRVPAAVRACYDRSYREPENLSCSRRRCAIGPRMIRKVVEQNAPPGSVPSEEYVEPPFTSTSASFVKGILAIAAARQISPDATRQHRAKNPLD